MINSINNNVSPVLIEIKLIITGVNSSGEGPKLPKSNKNKMPLNATKMLK